MFQIKWTQKTSLDRYENRPDNLGDMCLADFAARYI